MLSDYAMRAFAAFLAAFAVNACSQAPSGDSDKNTASNGENALLLPLPDNTTAEITSGDLATRIETLADDVFEGRAPGSSAGEASADWIADEMARLGVEPGVDGSY
ncbi:MAG: peptidase M28, partial [Pseudomonadota bacterium]